MRRFISNTFVLALVLAPMLAHAQFSSGGSVNIRAMGGTALSGNVYNAANEAIQVYCVAGTCSGGGGSSGGISMADGAAFTENTTEFNPIGGVFNDGLAAVSSGDAAAARITDQRGLHVNLRDVSGTEVGTSGAPVRVDPTGTTPQPVSGTVAISGTVTVSGTVTANQGGSPWSMRLQDGSGATLAAVTAGNAVKTDGSAVTQPISAASLPLPTGASTSANQSTIIGHVDGLEGLIGTTNTTLSTIDGRVDGLEGVLGTTADAAATAGSTGSLSAKQRLMTSLLDAIKTAVETIDNIVSGAGAAITSLPNEGQQTMANSISVAIASDQQVPDPCTFRAKSYAPINISSATTTQLAAASASNKLYVCAFHLVTNAANNVALVEDDTSACASPTAGIVGGTTTGTGYILAANGGLTLGSGHGTVAVTAATNRYVCLITSAATQLTGGLSYVLAP
jgi:hypothetical protein